MFLQEFQAKNILGRFDVAVPAGGVARTAGEARAIASTLGMSTLAVKAQIRAGGRGKAGGVVLVESAELAERAARDLLGRRLVTDQSGPSGQAVNRVLVEVGVEAVRNLYVSMIVDPFTGTVMMVGSGQGGEAIEDDIRSGEAVTERISFGTGRETPWDETASFAGRLGLSGPSVALFSALADNLRRAFVTFDATLIEINPLAVTASGALLALDVKMILDDNAAFRQPAFAEWREVDEENDLEVKAQLRQLNYVRLDGNIGLVANGAGLGLATLDMIKAAGGRAANFMDIRTTATSLDVAHGFALLLDNANVRSLLVNVHGGGMQSCDTIVEGLGIAMRRTGRSLPTVVRLAGNNSGFARSRFANFGCRYVDCSDMWSAAVQAVAAAR